MMTISYKVIYRNGQITPVAIFQRDDSGQFIFEYLDNPKYQFPGFDINQKRFISEVLWDQIAFRVPNEVRYEHPDKPLEELLDETQGKLVTDHFEFHKT